MPSIKIPRQRSRLTLRFTFLILAASLTFAADKPNFSGNWELDVSKSDFGGSPPPDSFKRKIEHREPSLILTDEQTSALGTEKVVRSYSTDGKEIGYQWMGGDVKSTAHWDGSAMVIVGKVDVGGTELTVSGTLTLSADGKTLTENDKLIAGGNEVGALKLVLVKK
jgi:hypothetical protein